MTLTYAVNSDGRISPVLLRNSRNGEKCTKIDVRVSFGPGVKANGRPNREKKRGN